MGISGLDIVKSIWITFETSRHARQTTMDLKIAWFEIWHSQMEAQ